ncbi:MAG TPA: SRPBCC domain-containing protein [Stellaceae bacterium]
MRLIDTRVEIAAPAALVWGVLTDFPRFPEWNPFITRIEGAPEPGARLRVEIKPPGKSAMTFRPTVVVARPEKELRWLGQLLLPGIFDGEHAFELESRGDGCSFRQLERFAGLLVPFFGGVLTATQRGFEAMNTALKKRAEA